MTRSRPGQLQTYVERIGEQVFAPPFDMAEANVDVLIVRAEREDLQAVVDRELNGPWQSAFIQRGVRYHWCASQPWFAVVLLDVRGLAPRLFKDHGWQGLRRRTGYSEVVCRALLEMVADERELLVMLPVHDERQAAPDPNYQRWYVPLVLNDSVPAILAGRELFGYPKIYGQFLVDGREITDVPPRPLFGDERPPWSTITIRAHGPRPCVGAQRRLGLIDVVRLHNPSRSEPERGPAGEGCGGGVRTWGRRSLWQRGRIRAARLILPDDLDLVARDGDDDRRMVVELPGKAELPAPTGACLPLEEDDRQDHPSGRRDTGPRPIRDDRVTKPTEDPAVISDILRRPIEYLFLRQFRDPGFPDRASYQAVVAGRATLVAGARGPQELQPFGTGSLRLTVPPLVPESESTGPGWNRLAEALGIGETPELIGRFGVTGARLNVGTGFIMWDRP